METKEPEKKPEDNDNNLSYELLHKENQDLRKEIDALKVTIKDMKEVIKCNLGVSDDEQNKGKSTVERREKLQKLVEEVFTR